MTCATLGLVSSLVTFMFTLVTAHRCQVTSTIDNKVKVDCSHLGLTSIPRDLPVSTTHLSLKENDITAVDSNAFTNLPFLEILILSFNKIPRLSSTSFGSILSLNHLDLRHNPVYADNTSIHEDAFAQLPALEVLKLGSGVLPLVGIRPLKKLREFHIVLDQPKTLDQDFSLFPKLTVLDFSWSNITNITRDMLRPLRNTTVTTISLRNIETLSNIEPGSFSDFLNLHTVNLACSLINASSTGLSAVTQAFADVGSTPLDTLIIDRMSQLAVILQKDDVCNDIGRKVRRLSLRSNHIIGFHPDVGSCLKRLEVLAAGYSNAPYALVPMPPVLDPLHLVPSNLTTVDVAYLFGVGRGMNAKYCYPDDIGIDDFFPSDPTRSDHLRESFRSMSRTDGKKPYIMPPGIEHLVLDHVGLAGTSGRYIFNGFYPNNSVRIIQMADNDFFESFPIMPGGVNLEYMDLRSNKLESITKPIVEALSCGKLTHLLLSKNRLYASGQDYQGILDGLGHLEYFDMSHNSLSQLHHDLFLTNEALKFLFLSHNELTEALSLNLSTLCSIKLIDLSYNAMRFLSDDLMIQLDLLQEIRVNSWSLNITGNPFVCDCPAIPFIQWLQSTNISIPDKEHLTCSSHNQTTNLISHNVHTLISDCAQVDLQQFALHIALAVVIPTVASLATLVAMYRWRWYIRWYYYSLRRRGLRRRRIESLTGAFDLDAYVIFSYEHDLHFVFSDLRPELEDEFGLNLFLYGRDDLGGGTKGDTVVSGMEQSRMVVAVVTPSFLKDEMCEFALHMSLVKDINSLIVLLKDDPDMAAMSKTLRSLISAGSTVPTFEWPVNECGQNVVIQNIATVIENYGRS